MSDEIRIFEHLMQKKIGNSEYLRNIVIFEEGPFVFRVVQDHPSSQVESGSKLQAVMPKGVRRSEWMCLSREAATEQALRCLYESRQDEWLFPYPAATSAVA